MNYRFTFFLIPVALLFFSNAGFSQSPNLGTTAGFVLFTTNGAVTNTGKSNLTGNVGTNTGAITGFGNVNGVMHPPDNATLQAAGDLALAALQIDATLTTESFAPLLGNGDTLKKGVYAIAGNTTLNLNLVLNAQGDPNAKFIFKIAGTLSTGIASQIILTNGAQACNVYWKVEGVVSMASGTLMKGTVIANNAAINMGTGVILEGRALSTAGAISTNGVTAFTPNGCGSPVLTGPAAPGLASIACYALFSGNGAVQNAGITTVTGDVGTNVGLTGGYDPLKVQGTIHPLPDVSTATAAADLLNVYTYLNNLPNDIELLFPAQFGNNLVLTPHTYIMNGAAALTDTVFLNAEGNTNAVFVIKIYGALSTSTYAAVMLMNGAKASNIFWEVNGAVSINNFTNFKGTIVCNNGAITLTTGVILDGRALTTDGALSTAAITATVPAGTCSTLPVSWLYFRGKPVMEKILLEWATTKELNNSFFTLEKSLDGSKFETLATVNASTETGRTMYPYSFTDPQPYSVNYYRILQTDKDGKKSYFSTIQVKAAVNGSFRALHYTRQGNIYIQTSGAMPGNGSIDLYNIEGKKIASRKIQLTREESIFTIEKPMQKGMYLLYIQSSREKQYVGKLMIL